MNDTKTMELRLPVQAAVDRTATGATLAEGVGMEASQVQVPYWWFQTLLDSPDFLPSPVY